MTDLIYAEFYLRHDKLGAGYRRMVLFDQGRKWVRLCEPPTATIIRLERAELGSFKIIEAPNWRRLRVTLGLRIRRNKEWGKFVSPHAKALEKRLGAAALEQSSRRRAKRQAPAIAPDPVVQP